MKHANERRKHVRFPVMKNIAKPVELMIGESTVPVPAILMDLSLGGMGLLTLVSIKTGTKLATKINLPGFQTNSIDCRIVWDVCKESTFRIGINFVKLENTDFKKIETMSRDYADCETRIAGTEKHVCKTECHYKPLCEKKQKSRG